MAVRPDAPTLVRGVAADGGPREAQDLVVVAQADAATVLRSVLAHRAVDQRHLGRLIVVGQDPTAEADSTRAGVLRDRAALGEADQAVALFRKLLPVHHAGTREAMERYRVEPYVLAADVYGAAPWTGRGGWTWYTGAAGWAYRFGVEVLLGIRPDHGTWRIDPCIPRHWPGFEVTLHDGATSFRIRVANPRGVSRGVAAALLDGVPLAEPVLPRLDDSGLHEVEVTMG